GTAMQLFQCPDMGSYLGGLVLPTTFQTFWGAFGHLEPKGFMGVLPHHALDLPEWSAPLLGPLTLGSLPPRAPVPYPPASWVYPLLAVWTWAAVGGGVWQLVRRGSPEAGEGREAGDSRGAEPSGSS